jgi:hypothetical protein
MQQISPEYTVWLFPSFPLCIPSIVMSTYRHLPCSTYSRAFCKPLRLWQNAQLIVCLIQSEGIPSALLDLGVQLVTMISCISTLNASLHNKTHIIISSHPLDLSIEKPPLGQMGAFLCSFFLIFHECPCVQQWYMDTSLLLQVAPYFFYAKQGRLVEIICTIIHIHNRRISAGPAGGSYLSDTNLQFISSDWSWVQIRMSSWYSSQWLASSIWTARQREIFRTAVSD